MRRAIAAVLLAGSVFASLAGTAAAQNATWLTDPTTDNFNTDANWDPAQVPTGTAFFGQSNTTSVFFSPGETIVGGFTLNADADDYNFILDGSLFTPSRLVFDGAGIDVLGGSAEFDIGDFSALAFENQSTAGSATVELGGMFSFVTFTGESSGGSATLLNQNGAILFGENSTAEDANITNSLVLQFLDDSSAGNATIINDNALGFFSSSTAANATITNNDSLEFRDDSTAGSATIINDAGATVGFFNNSSAGNADITNEGTLNFFSTSTAGGATIANDNLLQFNDTSTAGSATIISTCCLEFFDASTAGSATIANDGLLGFNDTSTAGSATIANDGTLQFFNTSTGGGATIANDNLLQFNDTSTAGSATIINTCCLEFFDASTAGSATITTRNGGETDFFDTSTGGQAQFITNEGGVTDFSGSTGPAGTGQLSAGSLAGAGSYFLGANELTVGGNNLSSEVSGVISDCGPTGTECINAGATGGALVKVGSGTFTLSGDNTYSGGTTLVDGAMSVGANNNLGAAAGPLNFDGGILRVTGTSLNDLPRTINWLAGGGGFDIADAANSFTVGQTLAGPGGLAKLGPGTLVLSGDNAYSGGTTIAEGTLSLGSNTAAGTGPITTLGSVIDYVSGVVIANPIILNSNDTQLQVLTGTATQEGNISETNGPRPLEKIGAGTLILSGTNSFTGPLTVGAGTLDLRNGVAVQNSVAVTVANAARLSVTDSETIGSLAGGGAATIAAGQILTTGGNNASTTFSGVIGGAGGLFKTGGGLFELTGTNIYAGETTVAAGKLVVNGSIVSATTVDNGGTLGGTGVLGPVDVLGGGIYAPGNSIGTQTVNGAFTLRSGAIFEVEANAAGQSDRVIVNGTVNLTGSVLRVLAENGNYADLTSYLIVDNDGGDAVIGTFGQTSTNLAFLTPRVAYDGGTGNDVVLTLIRNDLDFCSVARTRNQCNVADALNRFPIDNPLFLAMLNQTAGGARTAFDALSGEIHATLPGVLADESRYVREAVLGRLMQASYTANSGQLAALGAGGPQVASLDSQAMAVGYDDKSLSAPPAYGPGLAFWTRAYGAWGDYDGNNNAATADRDLGGFVSGMDASVSGTWRLGVAAGFSESNVSVGARHSSAEVESFHLAGYAGGMAGPLALRAGGAWAWNDIDTSRAVIFPGFFEREEASYNADTGQLFGEMAYPMAMGRIALEPFGDLAFVQVDTGSIRERGDLAALRGSGNDEDIGYSTLGLRAATTMHVKTMIVTPHVSAAWQHAFDDVTPGAALAFASTGIGFGITGVPLAQDSALIEAGLDLNLSPTATLGVAYAGQIASDLQDNAVKGRFTWLF